MKIFQPLFLLLFFCPIAHAQQERLVILSPHWEGARYEFQWAFQDLYKEATGKDIAITWLDVGGTSEILRFIRSEYDKNPTGINVDIFFGGGVEPYVELKRQKLLETYKIRDDLLSAIPADLNGALLIDPDYTWYSPVIGSFGILCNAEVLKLAKLESPKTWEDLTHPSFHSWVASSDPRKSGSSHMIYEIILQAYGWDRGWEVIFGLGRNIRSFGAQSNQPAKDVESGEVACAFAYDTQAWWAQKEHGADKMPYILPENLTVLTPDAVAILRGAPNISAAKLFIDFLLSIKGQRLWIKPKGSIGGPRQYNLARMPVLPAAYSESNEKLTNFNPFLWKHSFLFDSGKSSRRYNILNDLLGVFLLDAHSFLREKPVEFQFPKLASELEILRDAVDWNNINYREAKIQEWKSLAKTAYGKKVAVNFFLLCLPWIVIAGAIGLSMFRKYR